MKGLDRIGPAPFLFSKYLNRFGTGPLLHAKASRGKIGATSIGAQDESAVFIPPVR
jgi:hypothetical protein